MPAGHPILCLPLSLCVLKFIRSLSVGILVIAHMSRHRSFQTSDPSRFSEQLLRRRGLTTQPWVSVLRLRGDCADETLTNYRQRAERSALVRISARSIRFSNSRTFPGPSARASCQREYDKIF